jgi:hypothetical protein
MKSTLACILPQKEPSRHPASLARRPASRQIPTTLKIAVSSGMETKPAHSRGAMIRRSGSTPIISMLDKLLGGFHQADLGGQRRAGTPGKQQRGNHRPQLAQQGQRHHLAQRLLGTEIDQDACNPAAPAPCR